MKGRTAATSTTERRSSRSKRRPRTSTRGKRWHSVQVSAPSQRVSDQASPTPAPYRRRSDDLSQVGQLVCTDRDAGVLRGSGLAKTTKATRHVAVRLLP